MVCSPWESKCLAWCVPLNFLWLHPWGTALFLEDGERLSYFLGNHRIPWKAGQSLNLPVEPGNKVSTPGLLRPNSRRR